MPEKDDRSEKQTRTSVGIGNTEINRETKTTASDQSSSAGGGGGESYERDRYNADRGYSGGRGGTSYERDRYDRGGGGYQEGPYDDEQDDYGERARRSTRDLGESVRDTSRTVRRESTNLITAGCDLIGGFFIGLGEAISPRSRGGGSSRSYGNCDQVTSVCGGGRYEDEDNEPRRPDGWNRPPQRSGGYNPPPQRPGFNEPPGYRGGGGDAYVKTKSTEYKRTSR